MMKGFRMLCVGMGVLVPLAGCSTLPYDTYPYGNSDIDPEFLEGVWKGYGKSDHTTSSLSCNIKVPLSFIVRGQRAVSTCGSAKCTFNVPIKNNGVLAFTYPKVVAHKSDYGTTDYRDIRFNGQLSSIEGSGTFLIGGGGCPGIWKVQKVESRKSIKSTTASPNSEVLPTAIIVYERLVVWNNTGTRNFVVNKGDLLKVLGKRKCLSGTGVCWKVMNEQTGENGYVSAIHVKANHGLVHNIE